MKGVRKSDRTAGIRVGGYVVPAQVAIVILLALLYIIFLAGSILEGSSDAFILSITGFVLFALLAYAVRTSLRRMKFYTGVIDAFVILSLVPLSWNAAAFFGLSVGSGPLVPLATGFGGMAIAVVLMAALLFGEKVKPSGHFIQAGDLSAGLKLGIPAYLGCAAIAAVTAYFVYGLLPADIVLLLTSAAVLAIAGELLFRGMLLSRLLPVAGTGAAFVAQALAFGALEASFVYLLSSSPIYAAAVFLISAVLGTLWAWSTVKTKSILAATLSHAGAAAIILLPALATLLA